MRVKSMMNQDEIIRFIRTQKVAVVAGVDEEGFPSQKAMFAPRRIDGCTAFYFSTNTSSQKVQIFRAQPKASVYFYKQGKQKFVGIQLKGTMEVLTDHEAKASIWQPTDTMYYPLGVDDPDYCVLKFTAACGRFYSEGKTEDFKLSDSDQSSASSDQE